MDEITGALESDEMPKPEPGNPRLYDVIVYPSRYVPGHHFDIEAKFPDYVWPQGADVGFWWNPPDRKKDPELWVTLATWKTPWNDGKPNMAALKCLDQEAPDSRVRLEAMRALWELYKRLLDHHQKELQEAHRRIVNEMDQQVMRRSRVAPPMSEDEAFLRTQQPDWIPGKGPVQWQ